MSFEIVRAPWGVSSEESDKINLEWVPERNGDDMTNTGLVLRQKEQHTSVQERQRGDKTYLG